MRLYLEFSFLKCMYLTIFILFVLPFCVNSSSRGLAVMNSAKTNVVLGSRPTAGDWWRQEGHQILHARSRTKPPLGGTLQVPRNWRERRENRIKRKNSVLNSYMAFQSQCSSAVNYCELAIHSELTIFNVHFPYQIEMNGQFIHPLLCDNSASLLLWDPLETMPPTCWC